MEKLTIRATSVALPMIDDPDALAAVGTLTAPDESLSGFRYDAGSLRHLELGDQRLLDGLVNNLRTQRATLSHLRLDSVDLTGCDLSGLEWHTSKLTRVRFTRCKLLGAQLHDLTLENVVFDACKLDYALFHGVKAKGPVIFRECSLAEATFTGCDLSEVLLHRCMLAAAVFEHGTYRDADLRENDLSSITGAAHLKKVIINHSQSFDLATALARELEVTYGDDLDNVSGADSEPTVRGWR